MAEVDRERLALLWGQNKAGEDGEGGGAKKDIADNGQVAERTTAYLQSHKEALQSIRTLKHAIRNISPDVQPGRIITYMLRKGYIRIDDTKDWKTFLLVHPGDRPHAAEGKGPAPGGTGTAPPEAPAPAEAAAAWRKVLFSYNTPLSLKYPGRKSVIVGVLDWLLREGALSAELVDEGGRLVMTIIVVRKGS